MTYTPPPHPKSCWPLSLVLHTLKQCIYTPDGRPPHLTCPLSCSGAKGSHTTGETIVYSSEVVWSVCRKQMAYPQWPSESIRLSEVPMCFFGLTIFSRAACRPFSLWSYKQSCCSGNRCSWQNTYSEKKCKQQTQTVMFARCTSCITCFFLQGCWALAKLCPASATFMCYLPHLHLPISRMASSSLQLHL